MDFGPSLMDLQCCWWFFGSSLVDLIVGGFGMSVGFLLDGFRVPLLLLLLLFKLPVVMVVTWRRS